MKFLDKLNLRRFAKVAAIAAVGGSIIFGNTGIVSADSAGMKAFREAYTAKMESTRMMDFDLTLISPNFHMDIDSRAQATADGVIKMSGELGWTYTNLEKNYSTNNRIPFYIQQEGDNELALFVHRAGYWSRIYLPGLPAALTTTWKAVTPAMMKENIGTVKDAEVLNDTADMRIMKITLDGKKIANILEKNSSESFSTLKGEDLNHQREVFKRWMTAIRANDITFTWTVNKPSWETVTTVFDLTDIMRAYSRYVLDESAAGRVVLTDEERSLLDAMGYYAELKFYSTNISPREDLLIVRPGELDSAPVNDNSLDDIFYEMTTVVKKK